MIPPHPPPPTPTPSPQVTNSQSKWAPSFFFSLLFTSVGRMKGFSAGSGVGGAGKSAVTDSNTQRTSAPVPTTQTHRTIRRRRWCLLSAPSLCYTQEQREKTDDIQPADLWHHKDTQQHRGEKNWENSKGKEIGRGGGIGVQRQQVGSPIFSVSNLRM